MEFHNKFKGLRLLDEDHHEQEEQCDNSSAKQVNFSTYSPPFMFEGLPTEIIISVAENLKDIPTLENLIRSSPVHYNVYRNYQRQILISIFRASTDSEMLYEAKAVYLASLIPYQTPDRKDSIKSFIEKYQVEREEPTNLLSLDKEALHSISKNIVLILNPSPTKPMSKNEKRRITKAFYQIELFHELFHPYVEEYSFYPMDLPTIIPVCNQFLFFFSIFPDWEVAEMECIEIWLNGRCRRFIAQCSKHIAKSKPSNQNNPWARKLYNHREFDGDCDYMLFHGLSTFHTLNKAITVDDLLRLLPKGPRWNRFGMSFTLAVARYERNLRITQEGRGDYTLRNDEEGPNYAWDRFSYRVCHELTNTE
ncbi:hypothetical protein G7Y89_g3429 [Cudoniella acicularis]|uniref:Uncharacterized protein n=1 Tax=Cudoniella acicularis TaxID=354080 RepID=A0A8H4RTD4_9HELO|nr:hypothetical protein G7Y89_g3429 [Cudoniella acicularis]